MAETVTIVESNDELPLKHQFGKLMVGSIAAFGANKLAERAYDAALRAYRVKKSGK